jgi:hypothetical protein
MNVIWVISIKFVYFMFFPYFFTYFAEFILLIFQPTYFKKISRLLSVSDEKFSIKYEHKKKTWFLGVMNVIQTGAYISATT